MHCSLCLSRDTLKLTNSSVYHLQLPFQILSGSIARVFNAMTNEVSPQYAGSASASDKLWYDIDSSLPSERALKRTRLELGSKAEVAFHAAI
jgi:hypothetical protein